MGRFTVNRFSSRYGVRKLTEADLPLIYEVCLGNQQFYDYCGKPFSEERTRQDLTITPPGKDLEDKYYVGYFEEGTLVAVMDLIDGYPDEKTAFIGFFMMNKEYQGAGVGTTLITEICQYLKSEQMMNVRLAIDKENPQSNHFWKKNGFEAVREVALEEGIVIVAERALRT